MKALNSSTVSPTHESTAVKREIMIGTTLPEARSQIIQILLHDSGEVQSHNCLLKGKLTTPVFFFASTFVNFF